MFGDFIQRMYVWLNITVGTELKRNKNTNTY